MNNKKLTFGRDIEIAKRDRATYIAFALIIATPIVLSMWLAIALTFGGQS